MDDSSDILFTVYGWVSANRKRVVAAVVVVLVLAGASTLWIWHNNQSEINANGELMSVPLFSSGSGQLDASMQNTYAKIAADYTDTSSGVYAQLLAARGLFLDGKYPEAEQAFRKFVSDHSDSELVPQAQVGIAASLEAQGKLADATAKYKEITAVYSADANIALPAKLTLARLSEALGKPLDAANAYQELARLNDPRDPWVAEARDRLIFLLAKHPELSNPPAPKTAETPGILTPSASEMQVSPPSSGAGPAPTHNGAQPPTQQPQLFQISTNIPPAAKP